MNKTKTRYKEVSDGRWTTETWNDPAIRPVLKAKGKRSNRDTDVYLELFKDKVFLVFDNHTRFSAKKYVELNKESFLAFSDAMMIAKEYFEGRCKIEDLFPGCKAPIEELIKQYKEHNGAD